MIHHLIKLAVKTKGRIINIINLYVPILISRYFKFLFRNKEIWVFGGHSGKYFLDNSAAFFEYINKNHPEIMSYWVIQKQSPHVSNVKKIGKVLFRSSFKANLYSLLAGVHIYSHGYNDISKYNHITFKHVFKVFLGHGTNGLKKIVDLNAEGINSLYDMFIASSSFEKQIILINDWHVDEEKIMMTGLPRYDQLISKAATNKSFLITQKKILYMPTWRDWLKKNINRELIDNHLDNCLIKNNVLHQYLADNNIMLNVFIHVNMEKQLRENLSYFYHPNVNILNQNHNLQNEIIESTLLITDYSSIAFDFLLLDKPVIFYQFDYVQYNQYRGSYIDMKKDLFGPVAYDAQTLIKEIINYYRHDFTCYKYQDKINKIKKLVFVYTDCNNSQRVFEEIIKRKQSFKS